VVLRRTRGVVLSRTLTKLGRPKLIKRYYQQKNQEKKKGARDGVRATTGSSGEGPVAKRMRLDMCRHIIPRENTYPLQELKEGARAEISGLTTLNLVVREGVRMLDLA
jgi:hypothetical protein